MRTTLIILTLLTLISCNDIDQKTVSQNDRFELVPEPDKDLRKEYEQQEKNNLTADTTYQEFLGEELNPIREKLRPLSNRQEWTAIDKRKIETKTGNGAAIYYFLKKELKKIRFLQNTDTTDRFIEYYLDNDSLFFVFKRQSDSIGLKNDPEYYEPFEDSLFFKKGELIRIKSNMDCGAPSSQEFLDSEQKRLKTMFDLLINRLNRK